MQRLTEKVSSDHFLFTVTSISPSWITAEKHKSKAFAVCLRVMSCDALCGACACGGVSAPLMLWDAVAAFCGAVREEQNRS